MSNRKVETKSQMSASEHPVHLASACSQRMMHPVHRVGCFLVGTVRKPQKVFLNLVEDPPPCATDFVLQGCNALWPLSPIRFGM
jgi:hypothetical protein